MLFLVLNLLSQCFLMHIHFSIFIYFELNFLIAFLGELCTVVPGYPADVFFSRVLFMNKEYCNSTLSRLKIW